MSFHLCSPCCFAFPQAAASCQDAQWLSLSTAPGNAHSWQCSSDLLGEGRRKKNKTQTTHKVTEATHLYLWKYQITSEPRWNSCDAEDGESGCNAQWEQRGGSAAQEKQVLQTQGWTSAILSSGLWHTACRTVLPCSRRQNASTPPCTSPDSNSFECAEVSQHRQRELKGWSSPVWFVTFFVLKCFTIAALWFRELFCY